jgi:transposase
MPVLLSAKEIAQRLRCKERTIYRWALREDYPGLVVDKDVWTGRTRHRFDLEKTQAWLQEVGMWDFEAQLPDIRPGRYSRPSAASEGMGLE